MSQFTSAQEINPPSPSRVTAVKTRRKIAAAIEGYLYLAPSLIILTIFVFIPIVTSFQLSLTRIAPFGGKSIAVGFENYTRLFADPEYLNSLKVSTLFTLGTVPGGIILFDCRKPL